MTQQVGRRSHRGFYRKTKDISESAAESIRKWGFRTEIHRQTACVAFTKDDRTFFWHPVKKQFRPQGTGHEWVRLPPGKGVVALMLHLFGKDQLPNIAAHYGAMCDPPLRPHSGAAGGASQPTTQAGESHTVGQSASENRRVAPRSTAPANGSLAEMQAVGQPPQERMITQRYGNQQADDYDYDDPMTFFNPKGY